MSTQPRAQLRAAFHRLKKLLLERTDLSPEEELRLAAVLERAAADIVAIGAVKAKEI
jgi:hypothetical protein